MNTAQKRPAQRALQFALEQPWAITEGALQTILEIAAREHDVEAGLQAVAAKLGQPLKATDTASVRDGIATIPVTGPMFRYANLFTMLSGATSYETLATDFTAALEDPAVGAIILAIDSPGGEVNGTAELAQLVYEARGKKPIVAMVSGFGASAAYWLASAADQVIAAPTAVLGSIGVQLAYMDTRKRDESKGVRSIEIVSSQSPRKNLDPNVDAGRAEIQQMVDALAQVFVETVAEYRGVSAEQVLAEFGQGGVFVGQLAVAAGLADRIGTYEGVHAELAGQYAQRAATQLPFTRFTASPSATPAAAQSKEGVMKTTEKTDAPSAGAPEAAAAKGEEKLTAAQIVERYPEAAAALRLEGATAERKRILAIEELGVAGAETVIAEAKRDPACTPEATAMKLIQAQRAKPAAAPEPAPAADAGKKYLNNLAGDEAKANAPKDQPAAEGSVTQTVASLLQFSSRRPGAAPASPGDRRTA